MLTCFQKKPILFYNKKLSEYCKKTSDESIKRLTEKYHLERIKKIINPLEEDDSNNPKFNFYGILAILSISTLAFYFYKKLN